MIDENISRLTKVWISDETITQETRSWMIDEPIIVSYILFLVRLLNLHCYTSICIVSCKPYNLKLKASSVMPRGNWITCSYYQMISQVGLYRE